MIYDRRPLERAVLGGLIGLILATGALVAAVPAAGAPDRQTATGRLYLLQGLPAKSVDLYVNDRRVGSAVATKSVVGPMSLAAGRYDLRVTSAGSSTVILDRTVTVAPGQSVDAVVHLDSQARPATTLTVFGNDLAALAPGKTRLAIAHTADVPPADIRVDAKVLFSNVANGEGLTTVVPAATYRVDVVPTGTDGPAVLGPADFALAAGTLTRVFAIGQPSLHTMDAIVQVIEVATTGGGQPARIDTGSGGRAASVGSITPGGTGSIALGVLLLVGVGLGAGVAIGRRPHRPEAA